MKRMKLTKLIVGLSVGLLLMALLAFNGAGHALAACSPGVTEQCPTITTDVIPGVLSVTASSPAPFNVAVGGSNTTTLPITANDERGGSPSTGWTVSLSMTQLTGASTATLSTTGTVSLTGLTIGCGPDGCSDTGLTATTCQITTPEAIITDGTTGATVCDTGFQPTTVDQGEVQLNPTLKVAVPFNAVQDTYTSTVTVTIATAT
ncbi:MAG: hypothetical protein ACJ8DI_23825 [Ktedonobacteraceae bacterium]